jgi:hypothetical protein
MNIKPKYIGKRVCFVGSKGNSLDLTLTLKTKKSDLKEVAKKWPHWIEKDLPKDEQKATAQQETEEQQQENREETKKGS